MKTGLTKRLTAAALTAALMLSLTPAVLPVKTEAVFVEEYAIEKLVAMSETGLSKIIAGVDHACGDDKVSSFVDTWLFEDAGTAATVERIEALCEEILDRLDELEEEISEDTSKIEEMIAKSTADAAINNLSTAWKTQVDDLIPADLQTAVEQYQAYFRTARQYGLNPNKANRDAADAAWSRLQNAFVDVYQGKTGSPNSNAADLEAAMTTAVADNEFKQCVTGLVNRLNPSNSFNVGDYAAMAAYDCLVFSDDQYSLVSSYLQKQLLTIGWVMLTYNELMAMQGAYIADHAGTLADYDTVRANYQGAEEELAATNTRLLEEAAELMDREFTFSSTAPAIKKRLTELMKPEDVLVVSLKNGSYTSDFTLDDLFDEDSVEGSLKTYMSLASHTDPTYGIIQNKDNFAVKTEKTADFELVGILTGSGTEFYYILQEPFDLSDLEYKYDIRGDGVAKGDVHAPSCDWYNLRDWSFDFPASSKAEDVSAMFSQPVVLALNGNTARSALGEHSPYTGSQSVYLFTPTYQLDDDTGIADMGTSYADFTFLDANQQVAGDSVPSVVLSADDMQTGDGKKQNDKAIYIVKRTGSDRTVRAVTQGDCTLQLDVEQVKGRTAAWGDSVTQRFGNYLSIRFKAGKNDRISKLYIKRYLDSDRKTYQLEEIVSWEDLQGSGVTVLQPESDGYFHLSVPMPACDADILLTTGGEDVDDRSTSADFRMQKERLTALGKDTAVRTADVVVGSVSADGTAVASLTEQMQDAKVAGAFRQLVDETDRIAGAKQAYDDELTTLAGKNDRVSTAWDKLSGAWQYKVTNFIADFSDALDCFRAYAACLVDGTGASAAETAYERALNALAAAGDFRSDAGLDTSMETALGKLLRAYALTDETVTEAYDDPNGGNPAYFESRLASLPVQAARAAYEAYPFANDQYEMINTYLDAQINEIAWLLMMYQDVVSRQDPSFTESKGYPAHVSRLAQTFLAEAEKAMDADMTFWADKDSRQEITLRLSAYPTDADIYNGSKLLEYRFKDDGWLSRMGTSDWKAMQNKGYEMHYDSSGSADCAAEEIQEYNGFYLLPVLAGHPSGQSSADDLRFFQVLSKTHPLKTLEYKNGVSLGYDTHVPSTDYFNLMAQGYGDQTRGSSVTEISLNELAGTQAFVNSGKSLKDLLKPFLSASGDLYLPVTPDSEGKLRWSGSRTTYVSLPLANARNKTFTYEYISSDDFQAEDGKLQNDAYAFLRKADPFRNKLSVTGTVSDPGANGEAAMGIAYDNSSFDPANESVWSSSRDALPGSSVHLRIKPGDGETVTSLGVQRYTKEDALNTAAYTQVIADGEDFRYLDKDENGYYYIEVTVPCSLVNARFVATTAQPDADVSDRFRDVSADAWYHDPVQWAADKGLMNGVADDTFAPNDPCTRAMVVTMLWRMEGKPGADGSRFSDVTDGAWYENAVDWAAENGIVNGTSERTFAPKDPVTREQLAAILYRYAQAKGQGFTGAWMFRLDYPDAADVSAWADEAMHWMTMHGVINGMGDGVLAPKDNATRAQIAAMFMRFAEEMAK